MCAHLQDARCYIQHIINVYIEKKFLYTFEKGNCQDVIKHNVRKQDLYCSWFTLIQYAIKYHQAHL